MVDVSGAPKRLDHRVLAQGASRLAHLTSDFLIEQLVGELPRQFLEFRLGGIRRLRLEAHADEAFVRSGQEEPAAIHEQVGGAVLRVSWITVSSTVNATERASRS